MNIVASAYPWKLGPARRLKLWSDVPAASRPACFLFEGGQETYSWSETALPKRIVEVKLFVYAGGIGHGGRAIFSCGRRVYVQFSDAGKAVLASYTYTVDGAGQKFTVANQLLGTTPTFQAVFYTTFQGQAISLKLNNCTSNKLSFHTKLEDFIMPEFDFSCFADAAGNVMTWSFAEVS